MDGSEETIVKKDDGITIRPRAIEISDDGDTAYVAFELMSTVTKTEDGNALIVIHQEVALLRTDAGHLRYQDMAANAARKLERDFTGVIAALKATYA